MFHISLAERLLFAGKQSAAELVCSLHTPAGGTSTRDDGRIDAWHFIAKADLSACELFVTSPRLRARLERRFLDGRRRRVVLKVKPMAPRKSIAKAARPQYLVTGIAR